jgi:hypothetical protein
MGMKKVLLLSAAFCAAMLFGAPALRAAAIEKTERGAIIDGDHCRVAIENGVIVSVVNKLTGEEYLDRYTRLENVLPHLPGGMGTQAGEGVMAKADELWHWPWKEHPADAVWPCQHYPTARSTFTFEQNADGKCALTYKGLTDGRKDFDDEVYGIEAQLDAETGDLLLTPFAKSPRAGVYGAALTVSALGPAITVEAPIFDGMRLDREMRHLLYLNGWPGFWDYGFAALNGYKVGAVGIWCQDEALQVYKQFLYLVNQEGLSLSFNAMNVPPFEKLKEARPMTWRIQAFDKGWSQAAARFRQWRMAKTRIAPRPEWTRRISAVQMGVNASKGWLQNLLNYFGEENAARVAVFAPVIRAEGFDRNHANNTPYAGFKDDMKLWKEKGPKLMAYLQPMIMWGPNPKNDREQKGVKYAAEANTHSVFLPDPDNLSTFVDQHHLGQEHWQRWFLDWVKEYIQDCGADGVYHDQSYNCPIDRRGLAVNKMTSPQGMADYFYKAQAENPNSIHGTEHMNECNGVGTSLGIGAGILWGPARNIRHQRIRSASAVSSALHHPNGVIFSFPHFSCITHRSVENFHWGMDQMERRAELPGVMHPATSLPGPYDRWSGELKIERTRAMAFVEHGLRPIFPEDWDRNVLSYFRGANGEDFRYEKTPWGSAFVQYEGATRKVIYGRIHGVSEVAAEGAVMGWPAYRPEGPVGFHPALYYCLDPQLKRPGVWFAPAFMWSVGFYESYIRDGYACDAFAYMKLEPIREIGAVTKADNTVLKAPAAPAAIWVNGSPVKLEEAKEGGWKINFQIPATVAAVVQAPEPGFAKLAQQAVVRMVGPDIASDMFDPAFLSTQIKTGTEKDGKSFIDWRVAQAGGWPVQVLLPWKAPDQEGTLVIETQGKLDSCVVNGQEQDKRESVRRPMTAGEVILLSLKADNGARTTFAWEPKAPPEPPKEGQK